MEDLPYAIIAILVFWVLLVLGFIMFICRIRMRRVSDTLHQNESNSTASSSAHPGPQRIIQIYYVGNCDSSSMSTAGPGDFMSKIISTLEDSPPSYEEVSLNTVVGNNNITIEDDGLSVVPVQQTRSSSASLPSSSGESQIRTTSNVGQNNEAFSSS